MRVFQQFAWDSSGNRLFDNDTAHQINPQTPLTVPDCSLERQKEPSMPLVFFKL
jgi:hypothetical protein